MLVLEGGGGVCRDSPTPSLLDSPTLARVERALVRHEGASLRQAACCQSLMNSSDHDTMKRGVLWQQRERMFSRWKERYFVLTRDYLHCFKKASGATADKISQMGSFLFKVNLVGVEQVSWINRRNYSVVALDVAREGRLLLRADAGLEDWFEMLEECMASSKERRRALRVSRDASYQHDAGANSLSSVNSSLEEWLGLARRKIAGLQHNLNSDLALDLPTPNLSRPHSIAPDFYTPSHSRPQSMAPDLPTPNHSRPQSMAPDLPTPNHSRPQSIAPDNYSRPQSIAPDFYTPDRSRPQSVAPDLPTPHRIRPQQGRGPGHIKKYMDHHDENQDLDKDENQDQWDTRRTYYQEDRLSRLPDSASGAHYTEKPKQPAMSASLLSGEKQRQEQCRGAQHSSNLNSDVFFMSPPASLRAPSERLLGRPVLTPVGSFRSTYLFKPNSAEASHASSRHRDRSQSDVKHKWKPEERRSQYIVHSTQV